MEDKQIVDLFGNALKLQYRKRNINTEGIAICIAYNILHNNEDSRECVNDTYLQAWSSMPPHRPTVLKTYLGKIARNLALNRYEHRNAGKRGGGQMPLVYEELQECLPSMNHTEKVIEEIAFIEILNGFLASLLPEQRIIFMRRYWYFSTIKEIAKDYGITESKVKMSLSRIRNKLKTILEKEEIFL